MKSASDSLDLLVGFCKLSFSSLFIIKVTSFYTAMVMMSVVLDDQYFDWFQSVLFQVSGLTI